MPPYTVLMHIASASFRNRIEVSARMATYSAEVLTLIALRPEDKGMKALNYETQLN